MCVCVCVLCVYVCVVCVCVCFVPCALLCFAQFSSIQLGWFSSAEDSIYALRKTHARSTPFLRGVPSITFETVQMFVSLMLDGSFSFGWPFKEDRRTISLSTSLIISSRPLVL